ncbi:hypothetical protein BH09MYX1_BH09MYX1_13400 [soil metagenome]
MTSIDAVVAIPSTPSAWLREIATAYVDALETIPFGPLVGAKIERDDLFHLAPVACLKLRGIQPTPGALARATDAALSSYVAMTTREPGALSGPEIAFAFVYIAAHFGLDLVTEAEATAALDYVIANHQRR